MGSCPGISTGQATSSAPLLASSSQPQSNSISKQIWSTSLPKAQSRAEPEHGRVGTGSLLTDFHLAFDRYRSSPGTLARRMGGRAEARPALEERGSGDPVRGGCHRRVQPDYLNGSKSGSTILAGIVPVARNGFVPSAAGCRMASHD